MPSYKDLVVVDPDTHDQPLAPLRDSNVQYCYFYQGGGYLANFRHTTPSGEWLGVAYTPIGDFRRIEWFPGILFTASVCLLFERTKPIVDNLPMEPDHVLELTGRTLFESGYQVHARPR